MHQVKHALFIICLLWVNIVRAQGTNNEWENPQLVDDIRLEGARKAKSVARAVLDEVRDAMKV